jgi:hypothetical protein
MGTAQAIDLPLVRGTQSCQQDFVAQWDVSG